MDPCQAFQQALLATKVVGRFFQADDRYRPPKYILNGVETGELPNQVLAIWKYCVENISSKIKGPYDSQKVYAGATDYWRNKCRAEKIDLPIAYLQKESGATYGNFKIMAGDQIETWVKERMKSAGLLDDSRRTVAEWQLEIAHLKSVIEDAQAKVEKHTKGIQEGNRVKQRQGWLSEASKSLESATKDLDKAEQALTKLQQATERHTDAQVPVISFEQQFQLLLNQAMNDMSRKELLTRARAALAAFEQQIAGAARTAGVLDDGLGMVKRIWDKLLGCLWAFKDWADSILHSAKQLDRLFDSV